MKTVKRKNVVLSKSSIDKAVHEKKWMQCKSCGNELLVDAQVVSVRCSTCVTKMLGAPELVRENKSDKPRGWRFMSQFVDSDGTVYFHGEEQPELKGTLPLTDVNKIKSDQKKKRNENKKRKELRQQLREKRLVEQYEKSRKEKKESTNANAEFSRSIANTISTQDTTSTPLVGGLIKSKPKKKVISKISKRKKDTTKKNNVDKLEKPSIANKKSTSKNKKSDNVSKSSKVSRNKKVKK